MELKNVGISGKLKYRASVTNQNTKLPRLGVRFRNQMGTFRSRTRTVGGLMALVTLLGMMVYTLTNPGNQIPDRTFFTLISLISALLGVDVVMERSTLIKEVTRELIEIALDKLREK